MMDRGSDVEGPVLVLEDLTQLLDSMADGAYIVDSEQRVVYWSEAAARISGVASDGAVGQRCYEIIAGTDYEGRCYCRKDCTTIICARRNEAVASYDILARPGERRLWVNVSILPVRVEGFDRPVAVHMFREFSRSRRLEPFLQQTVSTVAERARASEQVPDFDGVLERLTPREEEILRLLAAGASVQDVALQLVITRATVRAHIEHLMSKLGVHTRLQAVVVGARIGLL